MARHSASCPLALREMSRIVITCISKYKRMLNKKAAMKIVTALHMLSQAVIVLVLFAIIKLVWQSLHCKWLRKDVCSSLISACKRWP